MLSYFKLYSALAVFRFIIDSTGSGITPVAFQEASQAKHQEQEGGGGESGGSARRTLLGETC